MAQHALDIARIVAAATQPIGQTVPKLMRADLPQLARPTVDVTAGPLRQLFGPSVQAAAQRLEGVLGGTASVRRRLERAGLEISVHDFRVQQIVWGTAALAGGAALTILVALHSPERLVPMLILTGVAAVLGVLCRENRLTAQVREHESRVLAELPAVAELLALAVAAGESPVAALERVVSRSRGALSEELGRVLGAIRTGTPVVRSIRYRFAAPCERYGWKFGSFAPVKPRSTASAAVM